MSLFKMFTCATRQNKSIYEIDKKTQDKDEIDKKIKDEIDKKIKDEIDKKTKEIKSNILEIAKARDDSLAEQARLKQVIKEREESREVSFKKLTLTIETQKDKIEELTLSTKMLPERIISYQLAEQNYMKEIQEYKKLLEESQNQNQNKVEEVEEEVVVGVGVGVVVGVGEEKQGEPEFIIEDSIEWFFNACDCQECLASKKCNSPKLVKYSQVNNSLVEKMYTEYNLDKSKNLLVADFGQHNYKIDFENSVQINNQTNRKRTLERQLIKDGNKIPNPKYIIKVPEIFKTLCYPYNTLFNLVELSNTDLEYTLVKDNLLKPKIGLNASTNIIKIVKVNHPINSRFYELKKSTLVNKTEMMLFHGTSSNNPAEIAREGLDPRLCKPGGLLNGAGVYFSNSAQFCNNNYGHYEPDRTTLILLFVKVLIGECKLNNPRVQYKRPPTEANLEYNSVTTLSTDGSQSTIYTVYEKCQAVITHIIYYKL